MRSTQIKKQPNHKFKAEQILNIFNAVEKNQLRWNHCKDEYFKRVKK